MGNFKQMYTLSPTLNPLPYQPLPSIHIAIVKLGTKHRQIKLKFLLINKHADSFERNINQHLLTEIEVVFSTAARMQHEI